MIFNNPNNIELIHVIESVAKEKGISKASIISSMENAIEAAAKMKYGHKHIIRASINPKTGETQVGYVRYVVEEVLNHNKEISLEEALIENKDAQLDDEIIVPLPSIDMGRAVAQSVRHIIVDGIKNAEREKEYEEFKDRVGEIFSCVVKKVDPREIMVDLGTVEAPIGYDSLIKGETFKMNDKIKVYLKKVVRTNIGNQLMLSRIDNNMLGKLMELEIPEIYDKLIEVKAVARDPGSKAKVAVFSRDNTIDATGCCIGVKGSRIRNVSNELNGEKIDIIPWSSDIAQFVINALSPAQISKVILYEDRNTIEVIVSPENLSLAIGRQGQNVKLAAKLVGMSIDVMTEEQESQRRTEEFNAITQTFVESLVIEEIMAQLLVANGYTSVEQIARTPLPIIAKIEGFDEELAEALQQRATEYIEAEQHRLLGRLDELEFSQELLDYLELDLFSMVRLAENGIKTLRDFNRLNPRVFRKILPGIDISEDKIRQMIDDATVTR